MVLKSIFGVLDPCLQWSHWTPRRSFVAGLSSASLQVLHPAPFQERVMLWLRPFGVGQSQALLLRVRAGGGGLGCFRIRKYRTTPHAQELSRPTASLFTSEGGGIPF